MFNVVAVDDCPIMQKILQETFLDDQSLKVSIFSCGRDAVEYVTNNMVDLFIIDWHMPNYAGKQLLQDLRSINRYEDTPIIILSGDEALDLKLEAKYLGATEWFVKPFDPQLLNKFIHKIESVQSIIHSI